MGRRYNDGYVVSNERCIGCNKCIFTCPVRGANISHNENGKITINVDGRKCIHCGNCIKYCNRNAREFKDDTQEFIENLKVGAKYSLIVDAAFINIYGDKAYNILGYLKSLGVEKIYESSFGGDISVWGHMRYLDENHDRNDRAFIANNCYTVLNLFEKEFPEFINELIPVADSVECTAVYVKKYLHDDNEIVLLTPCIAAQDGVESARKLGLIELCVTFTHLEKILKDTDLANYRADFDLKGDFFGKLLASKNSMKEAIMHLFPDDEMTESIETINPQALRTVRAMATKTASKPLLLDFTNCRNGCNFGSAISLKSEVKNDVYLTIRNERKKVFEKINDTHNYKDIRMYLESLMQGIDINDFKKEYKEKYRQSGSILESTYDEIFNMLHKKTEIQRHIDCTSCGYSTCREMVGAIAQGYSKPENCIYFVNEELKIRYYTDSMTQANNKEGFIKFGEDLLRKNPENHYIVGVMNINQLNVINDLYGFQTGNDLIKLVASKISEFVGEDGIYGRLSGGEFFILFEETFERMSVFSNLKNFDASKIGIAFPITFRSGLFRIKDRNITLENMVNLAMLTRDRITETSNNTAYMYDDAIKNQIAKEADITSKMHKALDKREFVPYLQPQYNHRNGSIVGAEVLCRWIDGDGKMVSPGEFIPIFEKNGFIKSLDRYMWETVFDMVRKWEYSNISFVPISVNVSRISVTERDFVETIRYLTDKYNIDKNHLHFEITESAYASHQTRLIRMVEDIRELGYKVAMDDFGSGYSSLNTLKNVPIDILKLDMGFLRGENNEKGERIIKNVVTMANELNLDIVSEGVETKEQADFLENVGCDVIQGYLYAKPMPYNEYMNILTGAK